MHTRTVGIPGESGSRVVGIEGRVDDGRPRHRNTGAKMVMDGCTNGDRVDEVRVGHVRRVGHSVVLAKLRSESSEISGVYQSLVKKVSNWAKSFRCSYFWCHILLNERTSVFVVVVA